ncbi:MAG: Arc family DNA-binding protein [Acidobacteriota bacterium]
MSTLYVENVPDELYGALRERARHNRRSIAAETIHILEQSVPTPAELKRRAELYREVRRIRGKRLWRGAGPSTEEMLREDRSR